MSSLDISYSALEFARKKMEVVSENIAKADVAGYKRKEVVGGIKKSFSSELKEASESYVYVKDIKEKESGYILKYDPENPSADEKGFVKIYEADPVEDMAELIRTLRYYELNLAAIEAGRAMSSNALNIGR